MSWAENDCTINGYDLILGCVVSPEQYDVMLNGKLVGYLQLHHGFFTVEAPDNNKILLIEERPIGDGCFEEEERQHFLELAIAKLDAHLKSMKPLHDRLHPKELGEFPMRRLTDHIVNPANDKLIIEVEDEPGAGGAHHRYSISGFDRSTNPSDVSDYEGEPTEILFQNGPIAEHGVNGLTHEALLAILIDRLRSFQAGPYACRENALALTKLEESLMWLNSRTRARMARNVEGTTAK